MAVRSPETAALGAKIVGFYRCKGAQIEVDGSSRPLLGQITIKLELDSGWIQSTFIQDQPAMFQLTDYRSYDNVAKQWTRLELTSASAHVISTSLGEQNGSWTWTGTESSSIGTMQVRNHEQIAKDSLKLWGEALLGGSWQKQYEMSCTR
jgi:hypothetical protein